jgi:hypothetical protein
MLDPKQMISDECRIVIGDVLLLQGIFQILKRLSESDTISIRNCL